MQATHVRGTDNVSADALSRDNATLFHILNPQAYPQPTPIPVEALDLILLHKTD